MDKVLIAEDNQTFVRILKAGLKKHRDQFEIIWAKDGEEAMKALKVEPVSLLVTDLQMPKIDGLALLAYANENNPDVPCIVMTAHGTRQVKERLHEDVLHYIEKPFMPEALASLIVSALGAHKPTSNRDAPGGSVSGISVVSFLQMIEMEQKTCLLEVESAEEGKGFFYFKEGELYDALYGGLKGVEAAFKMIPLEGVRIRFRNLPKRKVTRGIKDPLTGLIMEAMRLKDEMGA